MVTFKGLMTDTTQVAVQNIENLIPMRIIKVIKDNPALSQSQIAEMLGEKHDTIKYHVRKCGYSGSSQGKEPVKRESGLSCKKYYFMNEY